MGETNVTPVRIDVVSDSEYADEIAELEALRDQVLDTLAESHDPELARELLAGWPALS